MDDDLGRYDTAAGWDGLDRSKGQRKRVLSDAELYEPFLPGILRAGGKAPRHRASGEWLIANLWRAGEVALLYGEPGVGKSLFASQLAEAIAAGGTADWNTDRNAALQKPARQQGRNEMQNAAVQKPARSKGEKAPRSPRVVYIDLQRTASHRPGTAVRRLHFNLNAQEINETDKFRAARVHIAIQKAIKGGARVVILDDISLGGINLGLPLGPLRTLRNLRLFAAERGISIMVIAGARPRRRPRAASLSDVAFRHIAEHADSVFCLSASTYGPAYRYIRHLRSTSSPIIHDASNVLTFHLQSPTSSEGTMPESSRAGWSDDGVVPPRPVFKYLGECAESEHLRDYAAEALRAQREKDRQRTRALNRSSKEFLVDGLISGRYTKYLNGE